MPRHMMTQRIHHLLTLLLVLLLAGVPEHVLSAQASDTLPAPRRSQESGLTPAPVDRLQPNEIHAMLLDQRSLLFTDPASARETIQALLRRSRVLRNDSLVAQSLLMLGNAYHFQEYHTLAYETYRAVLDEPYTAGSDQLQNRAYNNMGVALEYLGRLDEALAAYLQSLEIEKRLGNSEGEAESEINIGLLYLNLNDPEQALIHLSKALAYFKKEPDSYNYALVQQNLSIYHSRVGDVEKALQAADIALKTYQKLGYVRGVIQMKMNIADEYIIRGIRFEETDRLLTEAIEEAQREGLEKLVTDLMLKQISLELLRGNAAGALDLARQAEQRFATVHEFYYLRQIGLYEVMVEAATRLGRREEASTAFVQYKAMVDSLNVARQRQAIDEMRLRLEDQEKVAMLQKQQTELREQRSRNVLLSLMLFFSVVALSGGWVFYRYRENTLLRLYDLNMEVLQRGTWPDSPVLMGMLKKRVGAKAEMLDGEESAKEETPLPKEGTVPSVPPERNQYTPFTTTDHEANLGEEDRSLFGHIDRQIRENGFHRDPDLTSPDLARKLQMSRSRLAELIKERTGLNFNAFINTYRVQEAMHLLSDPQSHFESIERVMEMCGFRSRSVFYTAFERTTGMSPAQFRRIAQNG